MVNVMAAYARIAREVPTRIHNSRRTLTEKATAADQFDVQLVEWLENLPGYLHKDRNSLQQPEFVIKQSRSLL